MQKVFSVDSGRDFGTWTDPTSRFMYQDSLADILPHIPIREGQRIADFGGANGLLKQHIPDLTTIDCDPSKEPDIVDDILQHRERYELGICRYVLHYLTDQQVIDFLDNVNVGSLFVIQFTNPDLRSKYANSVNEQKYFRTPEQLAALMPEGSVKLHSVEYTVTREFYQNRLGFDGTPHSETLELHRIDYSW